jgi:ent-kaurene synthase
MLLVGIQFIARNFQTVTDEQIVVPIGFDFTFSGMFTLAINMGLQFPVRQTDIDGILRLRENELKRSVNGIFQRSYCIPFHLFLIMII